MSQTASWAEMLLLPLLIFWARRPMQFSSHLVRTMATLIVSIALLMPLCDEQIANAADHDAARKLPYNAFRQDAQMGIEQQFVGSSSELNPTREKKLREGTLVPPTVGRFVPLGRRWMFVPDGAIETMPDVVSTDEPIQAIPTNVFRTVATGLDAPEDDRTPSDSRRNALRENAASSEYQLAMKQDSNAEGAEMANSSGNPLGLGQIVAVENLMLQRIVEAIRVDGADDRWTISGQLTEFFDENRLQLKTAERATSK